MSISEQNTRPLLLRSLRHEPIERYPVWLMRQAGRYMVEYRALKEKYSFLELCKSAELAHDISLQPIRTFDMDGIILFSDILLPLEALGIQLDFQPQPVILNPIVTSSDVSRLKLDDLQPTVGAPLETLRLLAESRSKLFSQKTVLGFAGAPWTLACYLIKQGKYKHFENTVIFAKQHPREMETLLDTLAGLVASYLKLQIEAGADAVQLFDSWAGILSRDDYKTIALPCVRRIVSELRPLGAPIIFYAQGASHLLDVFTEIGADCLSVDWRTPLSDVERSLPSKLGLQGNLDPAALFLAPNALQDEVHRMLSSLKRRTGYVANLGHGVLHTTPPEGVAAFVNAVKNFRRET